MQELDLSANQLGSETNKYLQIALKGKKKKKKIDLCHNEITLSDDVVTMAEAHPFLEELNFKHTSSEDELVKKLDTGLVKKSVKLHLFQAKEKYI